METFLAQAAARLYEDLGERLSKSYIILPSRRACRYFKMALSANSEGTLFAPEVLALEDFMLRIADLQIQDSTRLLFDLYRIYKQFDTATNHTLENFAPLGISILQDFDRIDRDMVAADKLFDYIDKVKALERWGQLYGTEISPSADSRLDEYFKFWDYLAQTYYAFSKMLLEQERAYPGLAFRIATEKIAQFVKDNDIDHVAFVGMNRLHKSEWACIQQLRKQKKLTLIWDADALYMKDNQHQAGKHIRQYMSAEEKTDWVRNMIRENPKNIEIIDLPNTVVQTKAVGAMLQEILAEVSAKGKKSVEEFLKKRNQVAVILTDETLLTALLQSLPQSDMAIERCINITMGITLQDTPIFTLVQNIFSMQETLSRGKNTHAIYYKDLMRILGHPYLQNEKPHTILEEVQKNNRIYTSYSKLCKDETQGEFYQLVFQDWNKDWQLALTYFQQLTAHISEYFETQEGYDIEKIYFTELYLLLRRFRGIFESGELHKNELSIRTFKEFFIELLREIKIPFTGEPIAPIQIMGLLESRALDFEKVILVSCNEGIFPRGKVLNSMLPMDIRLQFGLPTHSEDDATAAYLFYRLLHRSKVVSLLYSHTASGNRPAEKSRFIQQVEEDLKHSPAVKINYKSLILPLPSSLERFQTIDKDPSVVALVAQNLESSFSPTSISSYMREPYTFFTEKILKVYDGDEMEENMLNNTFGKMLHGTMEKLYKPLLGKQVSAEELEQIAKNEVLIQKYLKESLEDDAKEIIQDSGKNYLFKEVSAYLIPKLLREDAKNTPFTPILLEQKLQTPIKLPLSDGSEVSLSLMGIADRIDLKENNVYVIDYKTGAYLPYALKASKLSSVLTDVRYAKIIQLLLYKYLLWKNIDAQKIAFLNKENIIAQSVESYFIFFRNLTVGLCGYSIKDLPEDKEEFYIEIEKMLGAVVEDMLNPNKSFDKYPVSIEFT
ncbi:MAG: PD-(D/E)XK nuclease family protein [Bernardetiaceae bacterium]|nr:PD-(D/E)XK nuclease family protein [Bernardetiaceae bacterium]